MPESTGPSLTDITYLGRKGVKFVLAALVIMIVGRTFLTAFIAYWKALNPPPPPPPTVGFGLLPPLRFPDDVTMEKPTSYVLETATGTLPNFGDRAKVFFMPQSSLSLLADDRAREIAANYDFVFEPERLSSRIYRWTKSQPLESALQIDIQSLQFKMTTNYLSRPELIRNNEVPEPSQAVILVKSFLNRADLLPKDIATVSGEVSFKRALGSELGEAVSLSDADFLEIDLNRSPIDDKFRMYTPEGLKGTINAVVTGGLKNEAGVVYFEYNYHPVDYSQVHTYPLRSTQSAWQLLQAGEGFILDPGTTQRAVIRSVALGYYDDFEEQSYLQPILVFSGDGGFLAYVPAIDPSYVQTVATTAE